MAFVPILTHQPISSIINNPIYRNSTRENLYGVPVFFVPFNYGLVNGYGGSKYLLGYNYFNSPSTYYGNCTWWCWARLYQTMGTYLNFIADGKNWYDNYTGEKSRNADNIRNGDIIVLTDNAEGHVCFVEQVDGDTVHISQSAYSNRGVWYDKACLVTTYQKSDIYYGNSIDIYKDIDDPYYMQVVGVIHTGEDTPQPPVLNKGLLVRLLRNRKRRANYVIK